MDQQKLCIEISVKEIQIIVERMRRANSQTKKNRLPPNFLLNRAYQVRISITYILNHSGRDNVKALIQTREWLAYTSLVLSNIPTNLCMTLYYILSSQCCFVVYCIVLLIYYQVVIIQYNVMHKYVRVLDNSLPAWQCLIALQHW